MPVSFRFVDLRLFQLMSMTSADMSLAVTECGSVCGIPVITNAVDTYLEVPGCAFRWNDEVERWHAKNTGLSFLQYVQRLDCRAEGSFIKGILAPKQQ